MGEGGRERRNTGQGTKYTATGEKTHRGRERLGEKVRQTYPKDEEMG